MGRRIVVVGTTGSGKSTVARALARAGGLTYVELDAFNWRPGWVESDLVEEGDRPDRKAERGHRAVEGVDRRPLVEHLARLVDVR